MSANPRSVARQNEGTRAAILDAIIRLLDAGSGDEITFQAIALAADVSERTVFRHLPNHAAMRDALAPLISKRLSYITPPERASELCDYVARLYEVCEKNRGLVCSLVTTTFGRDILVHERATRLDAIFKLISSAARTHPTAERRQAAATIRYLASGAAWEFYRHQANLSLDDAIAAACTAVAGVLRDLGIDGMQ